MLTMHSIYLSLRNSLTHNIFVFFKWQKCFFVQWVFWNLIRYRWNSNEKQKSVSCQIICWNHVTVANSSPNEALFYDVTFQLRNWCHMCIPWHIHDVSAPGFPVTETHKLWEDTSWTISLTTCKKAIIIKCHNWQFCSTKFALEFIGTLPGAQQGHMYPTTLFNSPYAQILVQSRSPNPYL